MWVPRVPWLYIAPGYATSSRATPNLHACICLSHQVSVDAKADTSPNDIDDAPRATYLTSGCPYTHITSPARHPFSQPSWLQTTLQSNLSGCVGPCMWETTNACPPQSPSRQCDTSGLPNTPQLSIADSQTRPRPRSVATPTTTTLQVDLPIPFDRAYMICTIQVSDPTTKETGAGAGPNFHGGKDAKRALKSGAGVVESRPGILEEANIALLSNEEPEFGEWLQLECAR